MNKEKILELLDYNMSLYKRSDGEHAGTYAILFPDKLIDKVMKEKRYRSEFTAQEFIDTFPVVSVAFEPKLTLNGVDDNILAYDYEQESPTIIMTDECGNKHRFLLMDEKPSQVLSKIPDDDTLTWEHLGRVAESINRVLEDLK